MALTFLPLLVILAGCSSEAGVSASLALSVYDVGNSRIALVDREANVGRVISFRVEKYDKNGTLRSVFKHPDAPPEVTKGDLETLMTQLRGDRSEPSLTERLLRKTPVPERMPAYSELVIDRDGNVWAKPYSGPVSENCWHVFQTAPVAFAEACLAEGFEVFEIGPDWVLGSERDSLDVERVAVYELSRTGAGERTGER